MEKNLTFILSVTSIIVTLSIFILKYIFDFIFKDETVLKPKANQLFFIPSFKYMRNIIFQKVTEQNYLKIKETISAIYSLLLVSNTRYYMPEKLLTDLEQLIKQFDESLDKTTNKPINIKKVNKLFQKFCNKYFLNYNQYKNSPFSFSYEITSQHKLRIWFLRIKYSYYYIFHVVFTFFIVVGVIIISINVILIIIQIVLKFQNEVPK